MKKVYFNGIDVTENVDLNGFNVTYSLNKEDRTVSYGNSNELSINGIAAEIVKSLFSDKFNEIEVLIQGYGDDKYYNIFPQSITVCTDCEVKVVFTEFNKEAEAYRILSKNIIHTDEFRSYLFSKKLKRVVHAYLSDSQYPDGPPLYKYNVTSIHELFDWWSNKAGLTFETDLFNELLFVLSCNEQRFLNPFNPDDNETEFIKENRVNYTPVQFSKLLEPVWDCEARIIDGKFMIHTRRWFYENAFVIYADIEDYCISIDDRKLNAYGRFGYTDDQLDAIEGPIKQRFNDIYEWNNPVKKALRGEFSNIIEFGISRYYYRDFGFNQFSNFPILRLRDGVSAQLKLIQASSIEKSFIKTERDIIPFTQQPPGSFWSEEFFNRSLSFVQWDCKNNLCKFQDGHNPNKNTYYRIDDIKACTDLDQLQKNIVKYGMNIAIETKYGKAIPEEVTIYYDDNYATFKNLEIWILE